MTYSIVKTLAGEEVFHPRNRAIALNFHDEHHTRPKNQGHNKSGDTCAQRTHTIDQIIFGQVSEIINAHHESST